MQTLNSLQGVVTWLRSHVTGNLHVDSRKVGAGDGFIAWPGAAKDGRAFVRSAFESGATAALIERAGSEAFALDALPGVASFEGLKASTGPIAAAYFDAPSEALSVLAVTGTNGKTSTSWWLAQMLSKVQRPAPLPCAVVGTLGVGIPPEVESTGLTTPDPVQLQQQFRRFADAGMAACAIEASSIGIAERRLDGTRIRVAIFTNFTQDHLDYHGSMDAYWQAKEELFSWPGLQAAVLNVDDAKGAMLAQKLDHAALDVWTVSCEREARLRASDIGYTESGIVFTVTEGAERHQVSTALIGQYNVSNMLGVMAGMRALGVPLAEVVRVCAYVTPVPGRMDCLSEPGQPLVAIDYAHTPDALEKALQALRPMAKARGGKLWCVFGCGGDRDPVKRPLMAAVAEKRSDVLVVTSDNPRSEKPEAIICQILLGASNRAGVQVQVDRALAITETLAQADARDVVLLAGKGHEATQEVAGAKHAFSDKAHAQAALARRAARGSEVQS